MPSMPRVPNFDFAINFGFSSSVGNTPVRGRNEGDGTKDILQGNTQKDSTVGPNPTVSPDLPAASASRPEASNNSAAPSASGLTTTPLDAVIANLTGDVVIMGGYRGSILRSANPPHRQLWVPVKVGLNMRKVNMEVGLEPDDEERMSEHMFASGMIQNVGPIDISKRLFKKLRESENAKSGNLRVWDYGYDWRLSPHLLSRNLIKFMGNLPSNQPGIPPIRSGALVIAHSLGGLITRHAVNKRPELFSGVVYAGVPQSCINILGPMRNGDAVLFSSRVLTAQVNFTLRTSFLLLPLDGYGFIDKATGKGYPVDFFNVDDWIRYRWSPCTDPPLPPKAPPAGSLTSILKSASQINLQLPGAKSAKAGIAKESQPTSVSPHSTALMPPNDRQKTQSYYVAEGVADTVRSVGNTTNSTLAPQMGSTQNPVRRGHNASNSVSTHVTIPREVAITYLDRTLRETRQFKLELACDHNHSKSNRYPPFAVIYGKDTPTVYAVKVDGRDGIACADAYDHLGFHSGDGVCLAREAMLPVGYKCVQGGRVSSDRGHVTLLGDLNAVGRAIEAVLKGRGKGLGLGDQSD